MAIFCTVCGNISAGRFRSTVRILFIFGKRGREGDEENPEKINLVICLECRSDRLRRSRRAILFGDFYGNAMIRLYDAGSGCSGENHWNGRMTVPYRQAFEWNEIAKISQQEVRPRVPEAVQLALTSGERAQAFTFCRVSGKSASCDLALQALKTDGRYPH